MENIGALTQEHRETYRSLSTGNAFKFKKNTHRGVLMHIRQL